MRLEPYLFAISHALHAKFQVQAAGEAKRRGLSQHHHTGRLIAHHHTSYPALTFLITLSAILAAGVSVSSHADSQLSLTVLGAAPTVGATITQPTTGDRFAVSTQTVRGTCPLGLMVEIYRGGTFAGSTLCDAGGLYNLLITLLPGQNNLIARDLDALSQAGPDSATVSVFYDVPPPPPSPSPTATPAVSPPPGSPTPAPKVPPKSLSQPATQARPQATPVPPPPFYLESATHAIQGADPTAAISWQVQIHGGRSPYQITWEWGDGHQDTNVATTAGAISGSHRYDRPGAYRVLARVRDAANNEAVISLLAIINGAPAGAITSPIEPPGNLLLVWPALVMMSLLVSSFWLGERHKDASAPSFGRGT